MSGADSVCRCSAVGSPGLRRVLDIAELDGSPIDMTLFSTSWNDEAWVDMDLAPSWVLPELPVVLPRDEGSEEYPIALLGWEDDRGAGLVGEAGGVG